MVVSFGRGIRSSNGRKPTSDVRNSVASFGNVVSGSIHASSSREGRERGSREGPASFMHRLRKERWIQGSSSRRSFEPVLELDGRSTRKTFLQGDPSIADRGLWEIGMDHVLLGKEEEKLLGSRIQAWMHVERMRRSILEEDGIWPDNYRLAMALGMEVEEMERVIEIGEESRRKLILSNIALVRKIARRYEGFRMESSDLILAGILGLCLAADRYEPEKGTRFSTFAFWCIRMKIRKAAEKESNVLKVSSEFWTLVPKVKGVAADLENKLNRQPTAEEIGRTLGMKPTKVQCIINAASPHAQLDITIPFHAGTTGAMPPSMTTGDEECAYTRVQAEESGKILTLMLDKSLGHELLSKIIKMHFGIDEPNGRSMSLREIARELSIGPELCRCYLYTGLDHLRANAGVFRLLSDSYA